MAEQSSKSDHERSARKLQRFTIEFDLPNNRTAMLNHLKVNARGFFSMTKLQRVGTVGAAIGNMPDIPGQRLTVDPQRKEAVLFDPLEDDQDLLDKINAVLRQGASVRGAKHKAVPKQQFDLKNPDLLKSLLRELRGMYDVKECRIVNGSIPEVHEIDQLPGRYLYDPWNTGRKPEYRDEIYDWEKEILTHSL